MPTLGRAVLMAGGLALAVPAVANAETKSYQVCSGASFSTCAAVGVSVDGHWVTITVQNLTGPNAGKTSTSQFWSWTNNWQSWVNNAVNQANASGQVTVTPCGPGTNLASCTVIPSTTVTPEPVTMTLLATGLAGMGGVGFLRRRRKPIAAV